MAKAVGTLGWKRTGSMHLPVVCPSRASEHPQLDVLGIAVLPTVPPADRTSRVPADRTAARAIGTLYGSPHRRTGTAARPDPRVACSRARARARVCSRADSSCACKQSPVRVSTLPLTRPLNSHGGRVRCPLRGNLARTRSDRPSAKRCHVTAPAVRETSPQMSELLVLRTARRRHRRPRLLH